jgi:hypothetical protein
MSINKFQAHNMYRDMHALQIVPMLFNYVAGERLFRTESFNFDILKTALQDQWPFHVACRNGNLEEVRFLLEVREKYQHIYAIYRT